MKRVQALAPLLVLAAIVSIAVILLTRASPPHTVSAGQIGRAAPAYALARLDEAGTLTHRAFAGRAHLINVFASWCTPCRAEHPVLMALKADGVEILGVAYKDDPSATTRFLGQLGDPFSVVGLDPEGRFGLELGITGVPETFVIGADGSVRAVHRGPLTADVVEQTILPALAGR